MDDRLNQAKVMGIHLCIPFQGKATIEESNKFPCGLNPVSQGATRNETIASPLAE